MITEHFINFAITTISRLGYPGVVLLTALESLMVPIPPEVTLVFSGYLSSTGQFNIFSVIISAVFGALIGSTVAYAVGFHFKKYIIHRLLEKQGKFLFINKDEYLKAQNLLKKHGPWIITLGRLIPGARSVISILMGLLHVPFGEFIKFTFVGTLISSTVLTFTGYKLGSNWSTVSGLVHKFDIVIILTSVLLFVFYFYKKLKRRS